MRGIVFVDAVRVESELGNGDAVGLAAGQAGGVVESSITFGEVILAPNAPTFAHVNMVGTMAVVGELVFWETKLPRFIPDGLRHFGVILQKPKVTFGV